MIVSLDKILFFDIETAPMVESFDALSEEMQHLWAEKYQKLQDRDPVRYASTPDDDWMQAAVFAEFSRVVCISVGFCYIPKGEREWHLRTKSFCGTDERRILADFLELVGSFMVSPYHNLCGHNIKEFDIPFVCRRALINGLQLPDALQIAGKKPWEVHFLDTLELWKFGDFKSYTSLKTLTAVFGIPTPKDDIDGSQVGRVYYEERDLQRISTYCQKDVVATAQVFLRMNGEEIIKPEYIQSVS